MQYRWTHAWATRRSSFDLHDPCKLACIAIDIWILKLASVIYLVPSLQPPRATVLSRVVHTACYIHRTVHINGLPHTRYSLPVRSVYRHIRHFSQKILSMNSIILFYRVYSNFCFTVSPRCLTLRENFLCSEASRPDIPINRRRQIYIKIIC